MLEFDVMQAESFKGKVTTMIRGRLPAIREFLSDFDELTTEWSDPDRVEALNEVLYIALEREAAAALEAKAKQEEAAATKTETEASVETEEVETHWPGIQTHWKNPLVDNKEEEDCYADDQDLLRAEQAPSKVPGGKAEAKETAEPTGPTEIDFYLSDRGRIGMYKAKATYREQEAKESRAEHLEPTKDFMCEQWVFGMLHNTPLDEESLLQNTSLKECLYAGPIWLCS